MKIFKSLAVCALCALVVASCGKKTTKIEGVSQAEIDSVSYAVGVSFGGMLKASSMEGLNYGVIMKAMKAYMSGDTTLKIKEADCGPVIQRYMMKAQEAMAKVKQAEEKKFMSENKTKDGVKETADGLQYKIAKPGNDNKPAPEDTVEVNYKGTTLDGTVFDSSYERGETVKFPLNAVIRGWTEGLQFIGEGGKETLWIPFDLGYGPRQMGPKLPAYSTLIFDVELVKVTKAAAKPAAAAAPAAKPAVK